MANKNNENNLSMSLKDRTNLANKIQQSEEDLYFSTYYSTPENRNTLNVLKRDISNTIKSIVVNNSDNNGEPNISKLYERLFNNRDNSSDISKIETFFSDNDFINNLNMAYIDNRWIKVFDNEVDEVLKYMTKLQEGLLVIKDNILAADSFSKDFVHLESELEISQDQEDVFFKNLEELKDKYELAELTEEIYDNTSKYGETYIYVVPYDKALNKLLNTKNSGVLPDIRVHTNENGIIFMESDSFNNSLYNKSTKDNIDIGSYNFDIVIENGIISSIVEGEYQARQNLSIIEGSSLTEQFLNEAKGETNYNSKAVNRNDLPTPNSGVGSSEGLMNSSKAKNNKVKTNGCIIKILDREKVIPININDNINLGYYYYEIDKKYESFYDATPINGGMMTSITGYIGNHNGEDYAATERKEEILRGIAAKLADKIDANFINQNQNLKKEIYHILKYNDDMGKSLLNGSNMRISYIPPEDIHHIYFKKDKKTGRGVSDLLPCLIPAKLWVAVYINNNLAVLTRGMDKRVYYVKQSVEKNITKTLLKTINEIKKSNFNIRQIENINSVLNITGRFNDYIIPRGTDGTSPVEFEVMQGQQVEIKTELMSISEEAAINLLGVPLELIQNRMSPDYAIQYTMSNSKFLRFCYKRQGQFEKVMSKLLTKIYRLEYPDMNDEIRLQLPPPLFINVTNTNQLITNVSEYVDNTVNNIALAGEQDEVLKAKVASELKKYQLGSYVRTDIIDSVIAKCKNEITLDIVSQVEPETEGE